MSLLGPSPSARVETGPGQELSHVNLNTAQLTNLTWTLLRKLLSADTLGR